MMEHHFPMEFLNENDRLFISWIIQEITAQPPLVFVYLFTYFKHSPSHDICDEEKKEQ